MASRPDQPARATAIPPKLQEGQVRCPVCRNATTTTPTGRIRQHRDLFGVTCPNKGSRTVDVDAVAVALAEMDTAAEAERARRATVHSPRAEKTKSTGPRVSGRCHDCDRIVSGERRYCGPCLVKRGTL